MIAKDLRSAVEQLGNMIAEAACIVPFTGAGISTECGIPDFRSPGGLWTRNRPIAFDEFVSSAEARAAEPLQELKLLRESCAERNTAWLLIQLRKCLICDW